MIPTHNYPILGGSDDFVLADCGIGVGGHESKANFLANYGFRTKYDDNLLITGGYAPMGNGDFGPTIISPSNVISGYRGWEDAPSGYMASVFRLPPGYRISGGTSTATPTATGAIAMSARYVPNIPIYKQGNGVINIAGAWELLKAMDKGRAQVTITSSAPVKHSYSALLATPNVGVGLYERDGWSVGDHGERTVTFTRTSGPSEPMPFTLSFTGDSGTFTAPRSVSLPLDQPVPVTIGIAPHSAGVQSGLLTLDNPGIPGHAYRMLAIVVAAEHLDAGNHYTVVTSTEVPRPEMRSYFYRVSEGASALRVVLDSAKRAVQVAIIKPDTRTANATHVVAERAARNDGGGGGGGANARLPQETYVVSDPMPGVWEVRLTDIEDTRTFDWKASEEGTPVPPTKVLLTVSTLAADVGAGAAASTVAMQSAATQTQTAGSGNAPGDEISLSSRMADFTGKATSYPLGSARRERPTIREHEQQMYEVDVPAGSAALRVKVSRPSDALADLDVYAYDCTGKECRVSSFGADPVGDETVMIQHPAAGKWKIVVEASSVPSGSTSYEYADIVFNPAYGMVAVADTPSKRAGSAPWTARASIWTASLPAGREAYAAFLLEAQVTPSQPVTIGVMEVPGDRRVARRDH
jgi:hypothetical protein